LANFEATGATYYTYMNSWSETPEESTSPVTWVMQNPNRSYLLNAQVTNQNSSNGSFDVTQHSCLTLGN